MDEKQHTAKERHFLFRSNISVDNYNTFLDYKPLDGNNTVAEKIIMPSS